MDSYWEVLNTVKEKTEKILLTSIYYGAVPLILFLGLFFRKILLFQESRVQENQLLEDQVNDNDSLQFLKNN